MHDQEAQTTDIPGLARRMARSGRFGGWRLIAIELRFIQGLRDAANIFSDLAFRDEIDDLCRVGQRRRARRHNSPPSMLATLPPVPRFSWAPEAPEAIAGAES